MIHRPCTQPQGLPIRSQSTSQHRRAQCPDWIVHPYVRTFQVDCTQAPSGQPQPLPIIMLVNVPCTSADRCINTSLPGADRSCYLVRTHYAQPAGQKTRLRADRTRHHACSCAVAIWSHGRGERLRGEAYGRVPRKYVAEQARNMCDTPIQ